MAPCNFLGTAKATPETIWEICFAHMKWEIWDVDVEAVLEPSGGCENGTTFIFHMKSGQKVNCVLSEVVQHKSLTFSGGFLGGAGNFKGEIKLEPGTEDEETIIDYTFGMGGFFGPVLTLFSKNAIVEGTEKGLENMIRLSEEAQAK
jgi:hypothetical protein